MKKERILSEIARTTAANGGVALGEARFETETGIKRQEWYGVFWARWSDAIREAGFAPNQLTTATDEAKLLESYARHSNELGRLPTSGDLRLKRRNDSEFPSWNTFARFGSKVELAKKLLEFCRERQELANVVGLCENYLSSKEPEQNDSSAKEAIIGYVYLLKHGSRREYKIGRTNNRLRREGEIGIELPEKIEPIHVIETDDPVGVETYWHRRFADKRLKNEWFALAMEDVRAFKRWRRIV